MIALAQMLRRLIQQGETIRDQLATIKYVLLHLTSPFVGNLFFSIIFLSPATVQKRRNDLAPNRLAIF